MNAPRLLLAVVLTAAALAPRAWAGDDDSSGSGGLFGAVLRKAAGHVGGAAVEKLGEKAHLSGGQIEGLKKTGTAFRKSAEQITEKEEYFIGRAVAAQILSRYKRYDKDETVNRYVQAVTQAVAATSDRPEISHGYHAQVLDSDELNAMSTPGGFIFVTTGLLKTCRSEDELAAVLAHEIAHVARKHGLKTIKAARLTQAFELLGQQAASQYSQRDLSQLTDLFGGAVDDVAKTVVVTGYGRDNEYEADRYGEQYLQRANYDPGALAAFIAASDASGKKGGLLKTHPPAKKRVAQLSKQQLQPSSDYQQSAARRTRFSKVLAML